MGIGIPGLTGVIVGNDGVTGVGAGGVGIAGMTMSPGTLRGDSAAILFVRRDNFAERAFNGCVPAASMPPAAGSMSSSQAPQLCTESTYAVVALSVAAMVFVAVVIDAANNQ